MNYRGIIASDIDGTLIPYGNNNLDPELFELIPKLEEKGYHFVAASGRSYNNLKKIFSPVIDTISFMSENGTVIWDKGEVINETPLPRELIDEALAFTSSIPTLAPYLTSAHNGYLLPNDRYQIEKDFIAKPDNVLKHVNSIDEIEDNIVKLTYFTYPDTKGYYEYLNHHFGDKLNVARAGLDVVDFTAGNKGLGLKNFMDHFGVSPENTYAFGDNDNDVSMFDYADHSYIMKTDDPRLAKTARYQTESVVEELKKILKAL